MDLETVLAVLEETPAVVHMHPVSLCYLPNDVVVFNSPDEAIAQLDQKSTNLPTRWLIRSSGNQVPDRFPCLHCIHDPFTETLNTILFHRFDAIASSMLCQSALAAKITDEARHSDLVVFLLVDGLSYIDLQDLNEILGQSVEIQPCLVDVPSVTRVAFPNIIGEPCLAARLFDVGYHRRLGFSYWTREDNKLTDRLFHTIPHMSKVGAFGELMVSLRNHLSGANHGKTYVQIIRTGLDGYAHSQKRKPPVRAIVEEIWHEFEQLAQLCRETYEKQGLRSTLFLTADHGILWSDKFQPEIIGDAPGKSSPRWCSWKDLYHQREQGRRFLVGDEEFFCLGYPKLRRPLRIDEQGVHGGISFQESVVPFVTARFGASC